MLLKIIRSEGKQMKKIILVFLSVFIFATMFSINAFAEDSVLAENIVASGYCGAEGDGTNPKRSF